MGPFQDPIFRACTRPPIFAGVPLLPFLIITGTFLLTAAWTFYLFNAYVSLFLIMIYVPLLLTLRAVTRKDDQRLRQLMLRLRMRIRHRNSRLIWGAFSYSPIRYKKRKAI
jgi:type IV secretion system protein VirB3